MIDVDVLLVGYRKAPSPRPIFDIRGIPPYRQQGIYNTYIARRRRGLVVKE